MRAMRAGALSISTVVAMACGGGRAVVGPGGEVTPGGGGGGATVKPWGTTPLDVDGNGQTHAQNGKDTSAAWTVASDLHDPNGVVAVAFTQTSCETTNSCVRWARLGGLGRWEEHGDDEASWAVPPSFQGSDGAAPLRWGPGGMILAVPRSGSLPVKDRFVYVGVLSTASHANQDVFVAVSDDGARTFTRFGLVTSGASAGGVGRPAAAVDPVDGSIWVWWAQGKGAWVSSVVIPPGGDPPTIGAPDAFVLPEGAPGTGRGAMALRHVDSGGLGATEVLYAWPDDTIGGDDCPAKATSRGALADRNGFNTFPITWYLSSKAYGRLGKPTMAGTTNGWAHTPITVAEKGTFQTCVDPGRAPGKIGRQFFGVGAVPAIAVDPGTEQIFVAIARSALASATAIHLYTSTDQRAWTDVALPGTAPRWRPTLALLRTGEGGKLAVGYYQIEKAGEGNASRWATIFDLAAGTWRVPTRTSEASSGIESIPWVGDGSNGERAGMVAELSTGSFVDAWPDNRTGGTYPRVWAVRFR